MAIKVSKEYAEMIKNLKRQGFSTREIAKRLGIAPATAYYYAREVHSKVSKIHSFWRKIGMRMLKEGLGRTEGMDMYAFPGKNGKNLKRFRTFPFHFAFVHLGFTIICPLCGSEKSYIWLCLESGVCMCLNQKGCSGVFSLKTAQRREEVDLR